MVRAKFNRQHVVGAATEIFWRNGFRGTSMQDIFTATGLQPGSIYLAFGSKTGLYNDALHHYTNASIQDINQKMDDAPTPEEGICQILEKMVDESVAKDFHSCFLVKSQLELTDDQPKLYEKTAEGLQRIEQNYQSRLTATSGADKASWQAASIMLHTFGVRVYGFLNAPKSRTMEGLHHGLPWLPWSPNKR